MLLLLQTMDEFREVFPMLPLAFIGIGILAMLWLIRRGRRKKKKKPVAIIRIEDRYEAAISKIGSIKMNQWMDKHYDAIIFPRQQYPPNERNLIKLKQIAAYQNQVLARRKAGTGKAAEKEVC